jgi:very-short-patch-repair endonuclease
MSEEEKDELFSAWAKTREAWAERERPAREARKVFEDLYELHSRLGREGETLELLLGDGVLSWQVEGVDIVHPLLLKRIQLQFRPEKPEFLLVETDDDVELYTALFSRVSGLSPLFLKNIREKFEQGSYHPLDEKTTSDFLRHLVHQLAPDGEFYEGGSVRAFLKPSHGPKMARNPVIFLRERGQRYAQAIEGILEALEAQTQTEVPAAFWRFVGVDPASSQNKEREVYDQKDPWAGLEEVIFTKEWNAEQLKIIKRLQDESSALVQGPPGTGKTHTIANLIGHFLARGQSVLVTAHTSKALRVLKEKVVKDLQALCVSVLDDDLEYGRQLESSVGRIAERLSSDHSEDLELEARNIKNRRSQILKELSMVWQQLKEARALEYRELVILGSSFQPLQAAKRIQEGRGKDDWIPDPLSSDTPCPLNPGEVGELYALSASLSQKEEETIRQLEDYLKNKESGLEDFLSDDPLGVLNALPKGSHWNKVPDNPETLRGVIESLDLSSSFLEAFQTRGSWSQALLKAVLGSAPQGESRRLLETIEAFMKASSDPGRGFSFAFWRKRKLAKAQAEVSLVWRRLLEPYGLPCFEDFLSQGESQLYRLKDHLQEVLSWWTQECEPLQGRLLGCGFDWGACLRGQPLELGPIEQWFGALDEAKREFLARAEALERARGLFEELLQKKADFERKEALLLRLEPVAPEWAQKILDREGKHADSKPPGDPQRAWLYNQLSSAFRERGRVNQNELQERLENLQKDLRQANARLAGLLAWAAQLKKITPSQRQALIGWLDTVKRIGKGTGKKAPRLKKEAKKQMEACREAVPVWIMPMAQVVETFDPRKTKFDIVIVDEASQCDPLGLCALFMAKKVIVVGDHEQVSPLAVGTKVEDDKRLVDEYLDCIPNKHLYDGRLSVYDLARQAFGATVMLYEHFRCVSEVIAFSNDLCYQGRIKPLRDSSGVRTRPFVVPYRVKGAFRQGNKNPKEAEVIASLIMAAIEQPEYQKAEFGVISLVGDEQALLIDSLLRRHLSPETYRARRILCGNPAQFQGDERTVVFLSMVDVSEEGPLALRTPDAFRQRLNVAASRACDQMWVVYSLDPKQDLKAGDFRRRLIEHALDPQAILRELALSEARSESEFEKEVHRRLQAQGYRLHPQWQVGAYRIDLVAINDKGEKVAIECDGDRYHTIERLEKDMERQLILERLGWRFIRIRGSEFYQDPEAKILEVSKDLQKLGIMPFEDSKTQETLAMPGAEDLLQEKVVRRATEILGEGLDEGSLGGHRLELAHSRPPSGKIGEGKEEIEEKPPLRGSDRGVKGVPQGSRIRGPKKGKVQQIQDGPVNQEIQGIQPGYKNHNLLQLIKPVPKARLNEAPDPLLEALERLLPSTLRSCRLCKAESRLFIGRKGPFLACQDSSCKRTASIPQRVLQEVIESLSVKCPVCKAPMRAIFGRSGPFIGCTGYPDCKTPLSWKDLRFLLKDRAQVEADETGD